MNIAIIGNSHFGSILTKQLSDFDKANSYKFYNTNEKKIDKIKFVLDMFKINVVYSVSASIVSGGALNLALRFNKKIVQHFIGSDVLTAINNYKSSNIDKELIEKSEYLCEVDWIKEELKEIEISAKIVSIAIYNKENIRRLIPSKFTVLTYMSKGKEEYYGINTLLELSKELPNVEFRVAGIEDYYKPLPNNIKLLGWISMDREFENSVCYLRNAKHDGLAFSVLEALSCGKKVFYNYHFPHTIYFRDSDDLVEKISEQKKLFDNNQLHINEEAIAFVNNKFNRKKVLKNLVQILTGKL